jgi:transposase InsO family protein
MVEYIVWEYGKPTMMLSDNGQEFRSNLYLAKLNQYGIKPKRTTPGHPQTNGKVEWFNHELMQRLQRICAEKGKDYINWDTYIPRALFAFHAHTHKRWGTNPFYLTYGIQPILPHQASTPITRLERAWSARKPQINALRSSETSKRIERMPQTATERL